MLHSRPKNLLIITLPTIQPIIQITLPIIPALILIITLNLLSNHRAGPIHPADLKAEDVEDITRRDVVLEPSVVFLCVWQKRSEGLKKYDLVSK